MSAKNLDHQGRWRSLTVAFRVSPEEDALIESAVRVSGLTKQDYITRKLTDRSVIVQGNPKVYRGLLLEMRSLLEELKRINIGDTVNEDILARIDLIASIMGKMREEDDSLS
ncbi:hypothetical protein EI53_00207 [Fusobacterium naviforme]|nr:hypothetical protein F7P78_01060 [Fusobacterium naviforme]PSL11181.1 hypothetical protein EI53_00207 [Fusobacterium naviforme]STO28556.1 Uncharacterised protein [Fusobacterium naviforme]